MNMRRFILKGGNCVDGVANHLYYRKNLVAHKQHCGENPKGHPIKRMGMLLHVGNISLTKEVLLNTLINFMHRTRKSFVLLYICINYLKNITHLLVNVYIIVIPGNYRRLLVIKDNLYTCCILFNTH